MRFPDLEQLALPVVFLAFKPGQLHPDGRRYLPLIVLKVAEHTLLGLVDRHDRVDPGLVSQAGIARLVVLLGVLRIQPAGRQQQGFEINDTARNSISLWPDVYGQIVAIPTWEQHRKLGYDSLYTELVLDVGSGNVGVRTTITGADLAAVGVAQLKVGDWVILTHSRIDILAFLPADNHD